MPAGITEAVGDSTPVSGFDCSILVVSENLDELGILAGQLNGLGYRRVKTASAGAELREWVRRYRTQLLVIDLDACGATGTEGLVPLRDAIAAGDLDVVAIQGEADEPRLRAALKLGVVEVLRKPVGTAELGTRLRSVLVSRWQRERLQLHDGMTGLANREGLRRALKGIIGEDDGQGVGDGAREVAGKDVAGEATCVVLHVDLDRFRNVNESLGHRAGDAVIMEAAVRIGRSVLNLDNTTVSLRKALWAGVRVGRVTGNGFVLLVRGLQKELAVQHAAELAQRIHDAFGEPMELAGRKLYQTVSTGIALYPTDGKDADTLLGAAEAAVYQAKRNGRNGYEFSSAPKRKSDVHRLVFETEIRRVMDRNELRVHYQPKVEISSGHILGVEALVRWEHPEHGLISPALFIPLAEELGLITDIGRWVMEQACAQARAWKDQRLGDLSVSVNVSSVQLRNQRLWRDVKDVIRATGLSPGQLVLELTESMIMDDAEDSVRMLQEFKALGIQCSIDDFGTGYSSLAYLTRFPLTEIKIDRSFVKPLAEDKQSEAIVSAIIVLARELGAQAVAEGVETMAQLDVLRARGCHQFQGYLCSPPLPPQQMTAFLTQCQARRREKSATRRNEGAEKAARGTRRKTVKP